MALSRTYSTTSIVVARNPHARPPDDVVVYVEDYSIETEIPVVPIVVRRRLNPRHLRFFDSFSAFSEWCFENGVVVQACWLEGT